MRLFLVICFSATFLLSKPVTLDFLQNKPRGIARDFYIWRFLGQNDTSLEDAKKAYELVYRKNSKIENLLSKKGVGKELPRELYCKGLNFNELKLQDGECIADGLKLSMVPTLSHEDATIIITKLQVKNPIMANKVQVLRTNNILNSMLNSNALIFSDIYFELTPAQRISIIDKEVNPKMLANLANQDLPMFSKMLQKILISDNFKNIKKSILKADIYNVDQNTLIFLGISQARNNNKAKALEYFKKAQDRAKVGIVRDKALLWQYLISEDKKYLVELSKSTYINIFSIYANQKLNTKSQFNIISKIDEAKRGEAKFNISDPFEWQILRENLIKIPDGEALKQTLDEHFDTDLVEPHKAYMLNRIKKYKASFYLTPYSNMLDWKDTEQKAFTYAIARQESNLLPALISTSYALGMMQIMPFNVEPFAKKMGIEKVRLDDMFNPKMALEFGRFYIDELQDEFKHPLFVAYAYNGGPGFWRRTLSKKTLFIKNRKYEPWLSLELIPYDESKIYGMRVLANYVIYQELFGKKVDIEKLLNKTLVN